VDADDTIRLIRRSECQLKVNIAPEKVNLGRPHIYLVSTWRNPKQVKRHPKRTAKFTLSLP